MPGSSKGSNSFRSRGVGTALKSKFVRNGEIAKKQEEAKIKNRRLVAGARNRDYGVESSVEYVVNEPISDLYEDDFPDEEPPEPPISGEELFQHYLEHQPGSTRNLYGRNKDPGYKEKLDREQESWKAQEDELTRKFMEWRINGPLILSESDELDWFTCRVYDLEKTEVRKIDYVKGSSASAALVRAGYIPTAPLIPSTAFSVTVLEFYRLLNKRHRRLGLQPFVKALFEFHGNLSEGSTANSFSKAYDCYLAIRRNIDAVIDDTLGRGGEEARLLRACPACFYRLKGEDPQSISFLCAADGNMSLKRFKKSGTSDSSQFNSNYYVSREDVEKFADKVQVRRKTVKTTKNARSTKSSKENEVEESTEEVQIADDQQDAAMEVDDVVQSISSVAMKERGILPLDDEDDPLKEALSSHCTERWKADGDDSKKSMWECFDESGIFVLVCRHSHILLICDMVRSGEQSKYPLALIDRLNRVHPHLKVIGYDIGCTFKYTAKKAIPELNATMVVPAMHGFAHNRKCQLSNHPKYVEGCGIEDLETCERVFSSSNNCAGITRYTTVFHRHQLIHTHFQDHDLLRRGTIGRFIYNKCKEAGIRIQELEQSFKDLNLMKEVNTGVFERYLKEEYTYLDGLAREPVEERTHFNYINALNKWWALEAEWETKATKAGLQPKATIQPKLNKELNDIFGAKNIAAVDVEHFERILGVPFRWEKNTAEYKEASKRLGERKYLLALDRLERLVIMRIFELQKVNLVSTGYKMRRQIGNHLKTRSQTIRKAVITYNKAAAELKPPRDPVSYNDVIGMAFLAEFDILRYSRSGEDVRNRPWAEPATRILTDKYFELKQARLEVKRLMVEWRRLYTWIEDEKKLYSTTIDLVSVSDPLLAEFIKIRWSQTRSSHDANIRWLVRTKFLPYFDASAASRGQAENPEQVNPRFTHIPSNPPNNLLNQPVPGDTGASAEGDDEEEDEAEATSVGLEGCHNDLQPFGSLMDAMASMNI